MCVKLNELQVGEKAYVTSLQTDDSKQRRLLDLGLVVGTEIKAVYKSPSGDPTAYSVRGSIIALRSEDASEIEVNIAKNLSNVDDLEDKVIALAGNPNVGKSTVFNALTGMNQHTGNWPGKTVSHAKGSYTYKNQKFTMVDLPGTYSLMATSVDEEVARDFICFGKSDCVVVVSDATCLERNLNLVLQILEVTTKVVLCVNLLDEAKKKKINIDLDELSLQLGIPVVGTSARSGQGLDKLKEKISEITNSDKKTYFQKIDYDKPIYDAANILAASFDKIVDAEKFKNLNTFWLATKFLDLDKTFLKSAQDYIEIDIMNNEDFKNMLSRAQDILKKNEIDKKKLQNKIISAIVNRAEHIYKVSVTLDDKNYYEKDRKIDKFLTSRVTGIPIMILLIGIIFWITIVGANYPSDLLAKLLFGIEDKLHEFFLWIHAPSWLDGILVSGMYKTLAWVVSVMLPPMAIFFPLFTLLEDSGYLPRIAFNMDKFFKRSGANGKQALTMCMGFGCNACGVTGCRIIYSPRERLIATITNNFVPCNGRFPSLITIISIFFVGTLVSAVATSLLSALILTAIIVFGVIVTLVISKFLSVTFLKGMPSSFVLELPPYRKPQVGKVIVRSIFDRTLHVLGRAIVVAAPSGVIIWIMSNVLVGDISLLMRCANFLDPFANLLGLDGVILMAFILGFPANEIVIPIIIMSYMNTESILSLSSLDELHQLLLNHGWTWITAICFMVFVLMHFPCGTTCWTIKKETGSWKWTAVSFALPTVIGIVICFAIASISRAFV